jgi:hypothetical protein
VTALWQYLPQGGSRVRAGVPAVIVGLLMTGCAFGTNHVVLPAALTEPMPAAGELVSVRVKDSRTEVSGAQVGIKRNGYGTKTGSVELANGEALADRLGRDLVAISRAKGFRASVAGPAPPDAADVLLDTDISIFLVDAQMGFWSITLESLAVVRLTMVDARTQQPRWSDVVRVDGRKPGVQAVLESDHQQMVEDLYARLLSALRAAIPPPR